MISLVIILQHSTKSIFTYHLTLPTFRYIKPLLLLQLKHYIDEKCVRSYYQPSSHWNSDSYLPTSHYWVLLELSYQVLQLRKAYKTEPTKDGTYVERVTPLYKALCPKNLYNKAKIHGTLDAAEHGSLVSAQLFYERS